MFEKDIQFFHHCHPECIGHEIQGKYNYIPTLPEVFSSELDQKQASHCNLQPVIHVQYGEISRWSLVWVEVCWTINSPNSVHIFCLERVGRIKFKIFQMPTLH